MAVEVSFGHVLIWLAKKMALPLIFVVSTTPIICSMDFSESLLRLYMPGGQRSKLALRSV